MVIAESVPNFDLVMSIIGGTLTSPLVFFLPPLIYVKMLFLQTKHQESLQESSFTNVLLKKRATMNGVSKYIEDISGDETQILKNLSWTSKCVRNIEKIFCLLLAIFFLLLTVLSTYLNWMDAEASYYNSTMPCIYNITMTLLYL